MRLTTLERVCRSVFNAVLDQHSLFEIDFRNKVDMGLIEHVEKILRYLDFDCSIVSGPPGYFKIVGKGDVVHIRILNTILDDVEKVPFGSIDVQVDECLVDAMIFMGWVPIVEGRR